VNNLFTHDAKTSIRKPRRYWAPFQLQPLALKQLSGSGSVPVKPVLASNSDIDDVILIPPDQVLERWRAHDYLPANALEGFLKQYSLALDLRQQGVNLLTESQLLCATALAAKPLVAAVLLQILTIHPSLQSVLEQLYEATNSDEMSIKRLHDSCECSEALIKDWWDPHQGEAQRLQQLLLQQEAQQRRLMAYWARESNP